MEILATQKCVEVKQVVSPIEKKFVEEIYDMNLYEDMITVKGNQYPITSVFDISYRIKDEEFAMGFIYLHTSRGVRTYYIKEEPVVFINAYLNLKSKRPDMQ